MTDFLGNCVSSSCGLLESSSGGGSGTTLTDNNKLLGVGDKQLGTTDATNLEFLSDNKVRAILDANGNFDVRDLRTSELDILPNQQFVVVSGTATLSNYESTIQTTSLTDEFKVSSEFIPNGITATISEETTILISSGSSATLLCGVIDNIGNKTVCPSFSVSAGDTVTVRFVVAGSGTQLIVIPSLNDVALSGVLLTSNVDIEHSFYFTQIVGTMTITQSKVNDTELKGVINLVDNHNAGLSIRELGSAGDYLAIDTLNDTMKLSNLTDINSGAISFPVGTNQIVITQELVGSQESMIPNNSVVQQSSFSTLSGEILTITADEAAITLPITPIFTVGDKFELTLNIDKQTVGTSNYYIGVGEYSSVPLNYLQVPNLVYTTNTYYSTGTGFGGTFVPPGVWIVDPNFSAPSYNTTGLFEIKLVLEESGEFNLYIDGIIKFTMDISAGGSTNTFEAFVYSPSQGTAEFDTAYASMLSGDGGVIIDGYPVAETFNTLLGGDPNGVSTFNQVNSKGIIIGDEEGVPDPTTDNSLRFGEGGGIIDAEVLDLTANTRLRFSQSGLGEVMAIDYANTKLALENYHLETKRIDIGSYQANLYSLQPTEWVTLVNATASGSLWIQNSNTARGISEAYTLSTSLGITRNFEYEIKALTPHRHWIGISDSNTNSDSLAPNNQSFWFKVSVQTAGEDNFYRVYTSASSFTDVSIDTGVTYSPGDKIKFEVNSSNEVRLYLDTGSGYSLVSSTVYTITTGTDFYGRITDTSQSGTPTEIDLLVTDITPDFTDKTNKINIYDGIDIQFENDMKITRENDEYINFDVTNNEIDVFKDIQSTGNISCVSLTTDASLFPSVDTSKMLSIITPYTGQIVYNTEEGQGKFCFFNGTTWQVQAETWEAVYDGSGTLTRGQPVQVNQGGSDLNVIALLLNGSNNFAGIVCFDDVAPDGRCAVAEHGTWEVLCDSGTYTVGEYLQTSSTGRARQTTGISSQTWAIILENVTLASPGTVLARLRIYPP